MSHRSLGHRGPTHRAQRVREITVFFFANTADAHDVLVRLEKPFGIAIRNDFVRKRRTNTIKRIKFGDGRRIDVDTAASGGRLGRFGGCLGRGSLGRCPAILQGEHFVEGIDAIERVGTGIQIDVTGRHEPHVMIDSVLEIRLALVHAPEIVEQRRVGILCIRLVELVEREIVIAVVVRLACLFGQRLGLFGVRRRIKSKRTRRHKNHEQHRKDTHESRTISQILSHTKPP